MTEPTPDRRAELLAAAISDSLTAPERLEFDELRRADPTIDSELADLGAVAGRISGAVSSWDAAGPSAGLRERIAAISGDTRVPESREPSVREPTPIRDPSPEVVRRRGWVTVLAAAACLAVGVGVGVAATNAIGAITPSGSPGTLGAVEQVEFTGEPTGVSIDGAVVAHTWGTETVLEIDGLAVGDSYSVVVTTESGARLTAGSFLGSTKTVDCRMNAAVMRSDAVAIEIEDAAGTIVTMADLPTIG